jgi:hypothetical protein
MSSSPLAPPALPPFESVLKSRDVEDPVNLWVHRPLAYAFVALTYRTRLTPNQVTLLALIVGSTAAIAFVIGTKPAMLLGGALLWTSAILDSADGILARAKRMFSDVGRAIDGAADAVVALLTGLAAFYHLWMTQHSVLLLALMPVVIASTLLHVYTFDYYKEAFLQHSSPSWNGRPERQSDVTARVERLRAERAPWYAQLTTQIYVGLLQNQIRAVTWLNARGLRHHLSFPVSAESVRIYREHNRGPMQLWAWVSTAPHCYLMSMCAMVDRLDVYVWLRIVPINLIFVWACVWQRIATQRTQAAWLAAGLQPLPSIDAAPVPA